MTTTPAAPARKRSVRLHVPDPISPSSPNRPPNAFRQTRLALPPFHIPPSPVPTPEMYASHLPRESEVSSHLSINCRTVLDENSPPTAKRPVATVVPQPMAQPKPALAAPRAFMSLTSILPHFSLIASSSLARIRDGR